MSMVEEQAENLGQYAQTRKWVRQSFINAKALLGGPVRLPDCLIFLNTQNSANERNYGIIEAAKMCIPTVAIVDSNCGKE